MANDLTPAEWTARREEERVRSERMRENPYDSLMNSIVFDVSDWAADKRKAWIYGIVVGWSDESLEELSEDFGWPQAELDRLKRLHEAFSLATKESGALLS